MNAKRLGLTIFFIVLTLSIGLVSLNQPLLSFAQNSVLSQSDTWDSAEQEIGQLQSSEQDSQVVTGDSGMLSGNNLRCPSTDNSKENANNDRFCIPNGEEPPNSPPPPTAIRSLLKVTTFDYAIPEARPTITVSDSTGSQSYKPLGDPKAEFFVIPVNEKFSVTVSTRLSISNYVITFESLDDVCKPVSSNSCSGIKGNGVQELIIGIESRMS